MKIFNIIQCFINRKWIRVLLARWRNRGKNVIIAINADVDKNSNFEGMCRVTTGSFFRGYMGMGSYVGQNTKITAVIGRFTSIGPNVTYSNGVHPYKEPFVSTSPCFFSLNKQCGITFAKSQLFEHELRFADDKKKMPLMIGNDCWICQGAFFVAGVSVGDGAVVMAHAVVTKDVPPYAIVGGIPAKILGYRYDEETIQFLLKIKWWNNSYDWFVQHGELLVNMQILKQYVETHESEFGK